MTLTLMVALAAPSLFSRVTLYCPASEWRLLSTSRWQDVYSFLFRQVQKSGVRPQPSSNDLRTLCRLVGSVHPLEAQALVSLQLLPVFVPGDPGRGHGSEGNWDVQFLCLHHH